ncbi:glycosyl hydrolase family 28-related protein [Domibacillus enclensis]|uniref:Pectate lyase n=1 Tax=Domibacillus enclensis TaxID=1017273 RepID=A0A1N6NQV7_9BACI|nr:glycosyl hydrolase family 28-related protein [Domibacillus enclensis]OXS80112.1 pectate lyase [Domibacillus enclensis]SIP94356.1 Pectate lyase superfamily protein [Domibacillus enclensis]
MYITPSHQPHQNAGLIDSFFQDSPPLSAAVAETNQLFFASAANWKPGNHQLGWLDKIKSLWTKQEEPIKLHYTIVEEGEVYPDWKPELDREYENLQKKAAQIVHVNPGDDLQRALSGGGKTVCLAEGTYLVNELHVPSDTIVKGAGAGKTILKLVDTAPKRSFVLTNENHVKGNHHILIEGITFDWTLERLRPDEKSSSGNNRSSCLTFAHVTYGWVKNCDAVNPGLHCYDVSSTLYDYSGDGHRARGGSRYVWIDGCTGSGFGDDGITTHHSDYIFISNCFMLDPSGRSHKTGFSNSNGFEVDDGSRSVWLVNNASARCFGGVEVKAHATSSAAANVHIIGHLSENDNRSFNFRHIGHHAADDPDSKTARFLTATRIVSVHPIYTDLYASSKPRALTVSAYQHVVINGLRAIGDPSYNYKELPIAGIQYKAKHVHLQDVSMRDFATAGASLKVFGGANKPDFVTMKNTHFANCGKKPLFIAKDIANASSENGTTA